MLLGLNHSILVYLIYPFGVPQLDYCWPSASRLHSKMILNNYSLEEASEWLITAKWTLFELLHAEKFDEMMFRLDLKQHA